MKAAPVVLGAAFFVPARNPMFEVNLHKKVFGAFLLLPLVPLI
jgi:hypothetical protein